MLLGWKSRDRIDAHLLGISRQHDRGLDGAAVNAVAQFLVGKHSLRHAETRPRGGDGEQPVMRAQVLRHQRHRRAVAAMAGDDDELLQPRVARRSRPAPSTSSAQLRSTASACPENRYARWKCRPAAMGRKVTGMVLGQKLAYPREIGLSDHHVGCERQMRTVLFGRGQRQHGDPSCGGRRIDARPVDGGPVAGREG